METICDFCEKGRATVYCKADSARLCLSCDRVVHSANNLSLRHHRTLLCDGCNAEPASVRCRDENLSLCPECDTASHSANPSGANHSRHVFECFTGCPSAADLAKLWGCDMAQPPPLLHVQKAQPASSNSTAGGALTSAHGALATPEPDTPKPAERLTPRPAEILTPAEIQTPAAEILTLKPVVLSPKSAENPAARDPLTAASSCVLQAAATQSLQVPGNPGMGSSPGVSPIQRVTSVPGLPDFRQDKLSSNHGGTPSGAGSGNSPQSLQQRWGAALAGNRAAPLSSAVSLPADRRAMPPSPNLAVSGGDAQGLKAAAHRSGLLQAPSPVLAASPMLAAFPVLAASPMPAASPMLVAPPAKPSPPQSAPPSILSPFNAAFSIQPHSAALRQLPEHRFGQGPGSGPGPGAGPGPSSSPGSGPGSGGGALGGVRPGGVRPEISASSLQTISRIMALYPLEGSKQQQQQAGSGVGQRMQKMQQLQRQQMQDLVQQHLLQRQKQQLQLQQQQQQVVKQREDEQQQQQQQQQLVFAEQRLHMMQHEQHRRRLQHQEQQYQQQQQQQQQQQMLLLKRANETASTMEWHGTMAAQNMRVSPHNALLLNGLPPQASTATLSAAPARTPASAPAPLSATAPAAGPAVSAANSAATAPAATAPAANSVASGSLDRQWTRSYSLHTDGQSPAFPGSIERASAGGSAAAAVIADRNLDFHLSQLSNRRIAQEIAESRRSGGSAGGGG
ncbi:hypothetical protein CLOM_g20522 [Closterium sp. NIES-68]|nr:hypothetical protein CLOM_g20522 [Closterium sp. NIES-68]